MKHLCEEGIHLAEGLHDGDPQLTVRINQCLGEVQLQT